MANGDEPEERGAGGRLWWLDTETAVGAGEDEGVEIVPLDKLVPAKGEPDHHLH